MPQASHAQCASQCAACRASLGSRSVLGVLGTVLEDQALFSALRAVSSAPLGALERKRGLCARLSRKRRAQEMTRTRTTPSSGVHFSAARWRITRRVSLDRFPTAMPMWQAAEPGESSHRGLSPPDFCSLSVIPLLLSWLRFVLKQSQRKSFRPLSRVSPSGSRFRLQLGSSVNIAGAHL